MKGDTSVMRSKKTALLCSALLLVSVISYSQPCGPLAWNQWTYYCDSSFSNSVGWQTLECDLSSYSDGNTDTEYRTWERTVCPEYGSNSNFWCQHYNGSYWQNIDCPAGFP
jgi:hypothetical protein